MKLEYHVIRFVASPVAGVVVAGFLTMLILRSHFGSYAPQFFLSTYVAYLGVCLLLEQQYRGLITGRRVLRLILGATPAFAGVVVMLPLELSVSVWLAVFLSALFILVGAGYLQSSTSRLFKVVVCGLLVLLSVYVFATTGRLLDLILAALAVLAILRSVFGPPADRPA